MECLSRRLDTSMTSSDSGVVRRQSEQSGLGLSSCSGRQQNRMLSRQERLDTLLLERPQRTPAKRIHDVVLKRRVKALKGRHKVSSMSSTLAAALTFLSISLSSVGLTVSE